MNEKKSWWPVVWAVLKYAVTAILGYISNGTIL